MTSLFIANIKFDASETELRDHFQRAGAKILRFTPAKDRESGRFKGHGHIEVSDEHVAAALKLDGKPFLGRVLTVAPTRTAREVSA